MGPNFSCTRYEHTSNFFSKIFYCIKKKKTNTNLFLKYILLYKKFFFIRGIICLSLSPGMSHGKSLLVKNLFGFLFKYLINININKCNCGFCLAIGLYKPIK